MMQMNLRTHKSKKNVSFKNQSIFKIRLTYSQWHTKFNNTKTKILETRSKVLVRNQKQWTSKNYYFKF